MLKRVESFNTTVSRQIHLQSCPMEPARLLGTVRRQCCSDIFEYPAHSRRTPPKPVISLLLHRYLKQTFLKLIKKRRAAKKAKLFEAASERSSLNTATNLQMPNYELIAKFYTKHSPAQAHSSILQPCDFRNQTPRQQQALKPTAQLHQLHSKPCNAFI